ncbi:MAG: TonB family protein [candidate division WOR-3 bacterium]|nr:MAG: TonB family protein [candidate division WOR-3 bacterium]
MKDHKEYYGLYLRSSMLVSLAITILAFIFVPTTELKPFEGRVDIPYRILLSDMFTPTDIPEPAQQKRPKPRIVEPADPSDQNAQATMGPTDWDERPGIQNIARLDVVPYYRAQIQPKTIKAPPPQYPSLALSAGIEGTCVIKGIIDTTGNVADAEIYKSSGNALLDGAAMTSFLTYQFTPAYARDRPVTVWIRMPITFKIREE